VTCSSLLVFRAGVGIQDSESILYSRLNVGFVGYVAMSNFGARPQVPGKNTRLLLARLHGLNMVVESQFRVDVYTEKFSRVLLSPVSGH